VRPVASAAGVAVAIASPLAGGCAPGSMYRVDALTSISVVDFLKSMF
jgi:hypothetical protein